MTVVRYRQENGKICRQHGSTLIGTFRKTYGLGFAPGCADDAKLSDVVAKLDETSLSHLIRDRRVSGTKSTTVKLDAAVG
jgi:hypothetical protein